MELGTLDIILLAMIIGYAFWGLFKGFVNRKTLPSTTILNFKPIAETWFHGNIGNHAH